MYKVVKILYSRSLIFLTNSFSFSFSKRYLNWAKKFWKKSSEATPFGNKKISYNYHNSFKRMNQPPGERSSSKHRTKWKKLLILFLFASLALHTLGLDFQPFLCNHSSWKLNFLQWKMRIQFNHTNARAKASRKVLSPSACDIAVLKVQPNSSETYGDSP